MDETLQKRRYHSPQRQQQAELTRRKILDAARRLFATQGYAATTLPAIAREAGVSPPTVTAVFGTKARLLSDLINLMVRGDTESPPLVHRPWWQAMLAEPDPQRQLTLHATNVRHIHERSADVAEIVRGAATADPEIAAMLHQLADGRLRDARMVAQSLAEKQALAPKVTVERAADLLWALCSHDLYRMLVVEQHWPPQDYEQLAGWVAHPLCLRSPWYQLITRQRFTSRSLSAPSASVYRCWRFSTLFALYSQVLFAGVRSCSPSWLSVWLSRTTNITFALGHSYQYISGYRCWKIRTLVASIVRLCS